LRTMRRSVPQARQNWLSCRSSEPQDGQYMSGLYGNNVGKFLQKRACCATFRVQEDGPVAAVLRFDNSSQEVPP
jgi:hypothetical protein